MFPNGSRGVAGSGLSEANKDPVELRLASTAGFTPVGRSRRGHPSQQIRRREIIAIASTAFVSICVIRGPSLFLPANHANKRESKSVPRCAPFRSGPNSPFRIPHSELHGLPAAPLGD